MSDKEIKIKLTAEDKASAPMKKVGSSFKENFSSLLAFASPAAVLTGAISLVGGAFKALGGFIAGSIEAAKADQALMEETIRLTEQVGTATGITSKEVLNMSSAIAQKVALTTGDVQASANVLLANSKLKVNYEDLLKISADVSAAQNDGKLSADGLRGSTEMLSKILSGDLDSAYNKLLEQGISFNAEQEQAVLAAQKTGDAYKIQQAILDGLANKFEGAATQTESLEYKQRRSTNSLNEMQGNIGALLLPVLEKFQHVLADLTIAVSDFVSNNEGFIIGVKGSVAVVMTLIDVMVLSAKTIWNSGKILMDFGEIFSMVLTGNIKGAKKAFEEFKNTAIQGLNDISKNTGEFVDNTKKHWDLNTEAVETNAKKVVEAETQKQKAVVELSSAAAAELERIEQRALDAKKRKADLILQIEGSTAEGLVKIKSDLAIAEQEIALADSLAKQEAKLTADTSMQELEALNQQILKAGEDQVLNDRIVAAEQYTESVTKLSERRKQVEKEEAEFKQYIATSAENFLNNLNKAGLGKSKAFFEIQKRLNILFAVQKGIAAIQAIWANNTLLGPFGFVKAGIETAVMASTTAANVATLTQQQFPAMFSGGLIKGTPEGTIVRAGDRSSDELIVNSEVAKMLGAEIASRIGSGKQQINISLELDKKSLQNWVVIADRERKQMVSNGRIKE